MVSGLKFRLVAWVASHDRKKGRLVAWVVVSALRLDTPMPSQISPLLVEQPGWCHGR